MGDISRQAWHAKEALYDLLALARAHTARSQISHHLNASYAWWVDHAYLPELVAFVEIVVAWQSEIEAFLFTGITNAKSEGANRVIKLGTR